MTMLYILVNWPVTNGCQTGDPGTTNWLAENSMSPVFSCSLLAKNSHEQKYFHKSLSIFSAVQHVATEVKSQIEDFRPYIPLIQGLRNPGMRSRHWELLSEELGFPIKPKQTLTFEKCLELGLQNHIDKIAKVAEVAGKEYSIEQVCLCGHMVVVFTVL